MAFASGDSSIALSAGSAAPDGGDTSARWFAVSDAGLAALRIIPGLQVGESTEGELAFDDANSECRWLAFKINSDGAWLEPTADRILLTTEAGGRLERQPLLPGLVLAFPHNRVLVSQDILAHPPPGPVISVEQQPLDDTDFDFSVAATTRRDNASAPRAILDRESEAASKPRGDRFRLALRLALLSAVVIAALPVFLMQLARESSPNHETEPPLGSDVQTTEAHASETAASASTVDAGGDVEARRPQPAEQPTRPQSSATLDNVASEPADAAKTSVIEKISIAAAMLFGFDSAELSDDAKAVIDQHIQTPAGEAKLTSIVRVEGHTDSTGPEEYNLQLSQHRARAVVNYIESQAHDISTSNVEVIGKGASEPVASNDTREGRAQNRRVEIFVQRDVDRRNQPSMPQKDQNLPLGGL